MKYRAYPRYKDSGVEWLGEVPEHWGIQKTSYLGSLKSGDTLTSEQIQDEGAYPVYGANGLRGYYHKFNHNGFYVLIGRQGALCGNITYAKWKFWATEHAIVVYPNQGINYKWLGEVFRAMDLNRYSVSAAQPGLSVSTITSLKVALPPGQEQTQIATFLDRETQKIDTLIEKQERLIELLQEKRQAIISHAVTKGLDPNVKMKDSGVEWLGEVPEHWNISRIGWLSVYISYGFTNPMPTSEEGPYMLTANDIDNGKIRYESARKTELKAFKSLLTQKSIPKKNDILITKDGTLGRVAIHDGIEVCINQSVALMRLKENLINPRFFCYMLMGSTHQDRLTYEAGGTTIKHIYISRLGKMAIAFPNRPEQQRVVDDLDKRLSVIDKLIGHAFSSIALMKEHRTALISAAVTGKIDVRPAALRATSDQPSPEPAALIDS